MSIYQESKVDVFNLLSKKAGVVISSTDFNVSLPAVNNDAAYPNQNTKIRLSPKPANTTYSGSVLLRYNRLSLNELANRPVFRYPPISSVGTSVYSLLSAIKTATGLNFTQDDLEETFVTESGDTGAVLLKAKETSLGWVGQYQLILGNKPQISTLFNSDTINWD